MLFTIIFGLYHSANIRNFPFARLLNKVDCAAKNRSEATSSLLSIRTRKWSRKMCCSSWSACFKKGTSAHERFYVPTIALFLATDCGKRLQEIESVSSLSLLWRAAVGHLIDCTHQIPCLLLLPRTDKGKLQKTFTTNFAILRWAPPASFSEAKLLVSICMAKFSEACELSINMEIRTGNIEAGKERLRNSGLCAIRVSRFNIATRPPWIHKDISASRYIRRYAVIERML